MFHFIVEQTSSPILSTHVSCYCGLPSLPLASVTNSHSISQETFYMQIDSHLPILMAVRKNSCEELWLPDTLHQLLILKSSWISIIIQVLLKRLLLIRTLRPGRFLPGILLLAPTILKHKNFLNFLTISVSVELGNGNVGLGLRMGLGSF